MIQALILAQSAFTLPPAGPDQIEWSIRSTINHSDVAQRCATSPAEVRSAVNALGSQLVGDKPLFAPEQLKAWLASKSFTTPKGGESDVRWKIEARTGTFIIVTYHNRRYDLTMADGSTGPQPWKACAGMPAMNNAGGIALPPG